jgi:hypothetical protein
VPGESAVPRRLPDPDQTQAVTICRGVRSVPYYMLLAASPALVGFAVVLAVIRAPKSDLVDIVRALMRVRPLDSERGRRRDDDQGKPPSLPQA